MIFRCLAVDASMADCAGPDGRRFPIRALVMSDWKQQYEHAADEELDRYTRRSLADLLLDIRSGSTGEYSTIWEAVARKATPQEAGWVLYDVLNSDRPYLERYHCAKALLRILGCNEFEAVELSASWPQVRGNLVRLGEMVAAVAGQRGRQDS